MPKSRPLDAAVVTAPSDDAVREAQGLIRGGGKILLFAHTRRGVSTDLDLSRICIDEKDLVGSYSSDLTIQAEVAKTLFTRRLDVNRLITHRFPLEETAAAVSLAAQPTEASLKVFVNVALGMG